MIARVAAWFVVMSFPGLVFAQSPNRRELDRQREDALHDFGIRVLKIAQQYEQAGEHEKAKNTLRQLLQVMPDNKEARTLLDQISRQELTENKKVIKVLANQSWQHTGVQVFEGKPVLIEAKGTWVFRMHRTVGPDGLELPLEWKDIPLGSLVGVIDPVETPVPMASASPPRRPPAAPPPQSVDDFIGMPPMPMDPPAEPVATSGPAAPARAAKPVLTSFHIGSRKLWTPPATGTLLLKIHDTNEADNTGELVVTIAGQIHCQGVPAAHTAKAR
jgi:hypothetical protein